MHDVGQRDGIRIGLVAEIVETFVGGPIVQVRSEEGEGLVDEKKLLVLRRKLCESYWGCCWCWCRSRC